MATELTARPTSMNRTTNRRINLIWMQVAKNLLLVPLFPMVGYICLDQTGISSALSDAGLIPHAILGEGFGHVGLCFSIHYFATAIQLAWKACKQMAPKSV